VQCKIIKRTHIIWLRKEVLSLSIVIWVLSIRNSNFLKSNKVIWRDFGSFGPLTRSHLFKKKRKQLSLKLQLDLLKFAVYNGSCRCHVLMLQESHQRRANYRTWGFPCKTQCLQQHYKVRARQNVCHGSTTKHFLYRRACLLETGLENRDYGRRGPSRWPRGTLHPQTLSLTSPISGGRSTGIVLLRTKAMEFSWTVCQDITRLTAAVLFF
jgi:hypothetical protein